MTACSKPGCTRTPEVGRSRCRTCRRHETKAAYRSDRRLKVLLLDIETSPNLAYVWGLFNQNISINQLQDTTDMLCFAAKWLGDRKRDTVFYSEQRHGRAAMVEAAHALLDEADAVMHYNGRAFDIKHLNREFLQAGMAPPSSFAQIDLLLAVRKHFRFPSNKLQHISTALGLEGKAEHEGFDLWRKCMAGDIDAWRRMERYNRQDVLLLEDLYHQLRPWLTDHPSLRLYRDGSGCPTCGSDNLIRKGYAYTKVSKFRQYRCSDCGSWFRDSRRESGVTLQGVAR